MNRYGLFYNYKTLGDVLLIVFKPTENPDEVIKMDDVVVLKKNNEIIGINIFNISKIMKIKANGLIPLVEDKVLNIINHILENHQVKPLEKLDNSGFKVAQIVDIEENDYIPFINDEEINNKAFVILKDGDVIIADTAEDETVGKAVEVINVKNKKVLSGLHTIACRPNLKFANGYLGFYINSKEYHKQLIPLMQGIKVLGITKNNIKRKTRIKFPNLEIQHKIVIIMQSYNEKIKLLEKKLEEYEKMKKALMQKLLTGKVRVKI